MNTPSLYSRLVQARIAEALADTPVVLVAGPRQAGKTTLVRQMAEQGMRYLAGRSASPMPAALPADRDAEFSR